MSALNTSQLSRVIALAQGALLPARANCVLDPARGICNFDTRAHQRAGAALCLPLSGSNIYKDEDARTWLFEIGICWNVYRFLKSEI